MTWVRATLWIALIAGSFACKRAPADPAVDYPGTLVSTDVLDRDFMARQRVVVQNDGRSMAFDAVLQLHDHTLTLLALTPMGTKAFAIRQQGTSVEYLPYADLEPPVPPRFILLDVHRAHFMAGPPRQDGTTTRRLHGEEVVETWRNGRLWRRQFRRLDGQPDGVIDVRFPGGVEPHALPRRIELDNGWFGYRLRIETSSVQPLARVDPGGEADGLLSSARHDHGGLSHHRL